MQNSKFRKAVMAVAALMVFVMAGSTWAYASQELTAHNEFQVGKYNTEIMEVFEPPASWLPGEDVNKDVSIKNDGSVPVFLRVIINQKWVRTEDVFDAAGEKVLPGKGEQLPLMFTDEEGDNYAAQIKWGPDVMLLGQSATQNLPTVESAQQAKNKWLLTSDRPDANGNYTLYYMGVLAANTTSPLIVDSVELNSKIKNNTLSDLTVWDREAQEWVTTYVKADQSYECARYTLTVTMQSVQAMQGVASDFFSAANTSEQTAISYLESIGGELGYPAHQVDDTGHKLYFEETDGVMRFTPVRGSDGNWFMSWLNMLPGGTYTNTLEIQNLSAKGYELYMQAVPLQQSEKMHALLELITMKVYHGETLIYDGTASGKEYTNSVRNLRDVILLGAYKPSDPGRIRVELQLSKDTPLEYADMISRIDWKFMVSELIDLSPSPDPGGSPTIPPESPTPTPDEPTPTPISSPTPTPIIRISPTPPAGGPKTGDENSFMLYMVVMAISGTLLVLCTIYLKKTKKREQY